MSALGQKQTFGSTERNVLVRTHSNAPDFENAAGPTFEGVEVASGALRLYSEQKHFHVAVRAKKQRLDWLFRGRVGLWERTNVSHACTPLVVAFVAH